MKCEASSGSVRISWPKPWNGAITHEYGVWNHEHFREYRTTQTELALDKLEPNKEYQFWVRALTPVEGPYGPKVVCKPL